MIKTEWTNPIQKNKLKESSVTVIWRNIGRIILSRSGRGVNDDSRLTEPPHFEKIPVKGEGGLTPASREIPPGAAMCVTGHDMTKHRTSPLPADFIYLLSGQSCLSLLLFSKRLQSLFCNGECRLSEPSSTDGSSIPAASCP